MVDEEAQVEVVVVDSTDPFRNDVCAEMGEIKNRIRVVGRDKKTSAVRLKHPHQPIYLRRYLYICWFLRFGILKRSDGVTRC